MVDFRKLKKKALRAITGESEMQRRARFALEQEAFAKAKSKASVIQAEKRGRIAGGGATPAEKKQRKAKMMQLGDIMGKGNLMDGGKKKKKRELGDFGLKI